MLFALHIATNAQLLYDSADPTATASVKPNLASVIGDDPNKLFAPDGSLSSQFGSSVDIDGDTMVVGAPNQTIENNNTLGAAYVFTRIAGVWQFEAKLEPDSDQVNSAFGNAVAVSGNSIIVGAPSETVNSISRAGAAYIFFKSESGWTLQQKVFAFNVTQSVSFGSSVDIDMDSATVSDTGVFLSNPGAAYVFSRTAGVWSPDARLFDPIGPSSGQYGRSVALKGDTVVLGAPFASGPVVGQSGLVLVFVKANGTWTLQTQLFASDGADGDQFGAEVGIDGNTIVVGAPRSKNGVNNHSGAAYLFIRDSGNWSLQQKVNYTDSDTGFGFGSSVAISGDHVIVGDSQSNTHGISFEGAASVFVRSGTQWSIQNRLSPSDGNVNDRFGSDVSIQGNEFVVGSPLADINNVNQGAAYYFLQSPTAPDLEASCDSGVSNTDNITKTQDLIFDIGGVTPGATVELLRDGAVVDSKVVNDTVTTLSDLSLPDGTFKYTSRQIVSGETSSQSDFLVVTVDNTAPAVSINQSLSQSDPARLQPVAFDIKFNETIVGFDPSHISLAASTAGVGTATVTMTGSDSNLTASVSDISTDGTVTASVTAAAAQDLAGNQSLASASTDNSILLDTTPPTVTINQAPGQPDPASHLPINYTIVFSEPVVDFAASRVDFQLTGVNIDGETKSATGGPTTYNFAVSNFTSNGQTARALIHANEFHDAAGNGILESTNSDNAILVDNVGPFVTINLASGQIDPTGIFPVNYTVQFSEPVTGFSSSDLSYSGSTVNTSNVNAVITGSGASYNVAISNVSRGGILKVSVFAGAVQDPLGNPSSASTSTHNTVNLDYLTDPGFEFTNISGVNPYWNSTSARFGTSLCSLALCGNGNGTAGPRTGNGWIWFDGSDQTTAEQATASQNIVFPSGGVAKLNYYLRIGAVSAPSTSTLQVKIDGIVVQTILEPAVADAAYNLQTIDVSAYTDGGTHLLSFEYDRPSGATFDNFTIDDVSLSVQLPTIHHTIFDFDGDGKTDASIFRPSDGTWWYVKSSTGTVPAFQFGQGTDKIAAADFTGDGKTDVAFFRPSTGQWFVLRSEDENFFAFPFGTNGDIPMPADYDGDGKADAAVFRPSTGTWFILRSSDGQVSFVQLGGQGDQPIAADYDGDGKADVGIFRPNGANPGASEWWILRSRDGLLAFQFGTPTDKAVPGDYTGDGKADIAFFRPSTGFWFVLRSEDFNFFAFPFGTAGDVPVPGDYDGDGKFDPAVFRPSASTWFMNRSTAGVQIVSFGLPTDQPVPNAYVR